jgi:XTP/dITP diphosphohydrolase
MRRLVVASGNPGKLGELQALLEPLGIQPVPQGSLGIPDAEEPHETFLDNALAKARHASRASGLPALADDSGLCVDALDGAPGVQSAYFAGTAGSREERDARNNRKLLEKLGAERRAHYVCCLVLVRRADDPNPLVAEGRWDGEIARAPRGTNGFGYDPYFYLPELGKTAAELEPEHKNRISHRGQALARLAALLKDADLD